MGEPIAALRSSAVPQWARREARGRLLAHRRGWKPDNGTIFPSFAAVSRRAGATWAGVLQQKSRRGEQRRGLAAATHGRRGERAWSNRASLVARSFANSHNQRRAGWVRLTRLTTESGHA